MKVDVADQMSLTSKHRPSADSGDIAPLPIDDDIRPYRTAYHVTKLTFAVYITSEQTSACA